MRKEETVRIIPEKKEVTTKYYGNCPECGFEQIYNYKSGNLDKECSECKQKREKKEYQECLNNYIDAKVLSISKDNSNIIIKTKDNRVYELWFYRDEDGGAELNISELYEGNAEWFKEEVIS